jgi:hypothetical protein
MTYESRDTETVEPREPTPAGSQVNVNSRGAGPVVEETNPLVIVRRVLGLLFGILVALIVLRVLLLALGANAGNALVDGIYSITEPFVAASSPSTRCRPRGAARSISPPSWRSSAGR